MAEPQSFQKLVVSEKETSSFSALLGDERLLGRLQAAQFLGVSPRTIDSWTANLRPKKQKPGVRSIASSIQPSRDRLSYIKLGHKVFFLLRDLRRFRDDRKVAA